MKIKPNETALIGRWISEGDEVRGDETTQRIKKLISEHLVKIARDWSGWETLYQDPTDGRYWEHIYPQGDMHGGGPPALILISAEQAREKYKVDL